MEKQERLLAAAEAKNLDKQAAEKLAIPTLVLMENAGRAVAEEALKTIKGQEAKVAIFCGKGNNGGDGFVACRHLLTLGLSSEVFLAGEISEIKKEAKVNLEILLKMQQKVKEINLSNLYLLKRQIAQYTLMIDALLGVGLKGVVRGIYADLIKLMNSQAAYILAVDIPSGLDASSGRVLGTCVKADKTVSLIAKKRGMVLRDGPKYCGRVVVRDIGIPLSNLRL